MERNLERGTELEIIFLRSASFLGWNWNCILKHDLSLKAPSFEAHFVHPASSMLCKAMRLRPK